jgi:hypothetical protein
MHASTRSTPYAPEVFPDDSTDNRTKPEEPEATQRAEIDQTMNTPKFQIDLTEKFATLKNAPIVEAVIQFNAPPSVPFQQLELKELLAMEFAGYKIHDSVQHETGFQSSADGNVAITIDPNGAAIAFIPMMASIFANGNATASLSIGCSRTIPGPSCWTRSGYY